MDRAARSGSSSPVVLGFSNLVHREAAVRDYLLERNSVATLPEILARSGYGMAVALRKLVIIVNHDFKDRDDGFEFFRPEAIDQLVRMLLHFESIGQHDLSIRLQKTNPRRSTIASAGVFVPRLLSIKTNYRRYPRAYPPPR